MFGLSSLLWNSDMTALAPVFVLLVYLHGVERPQVEGAYPIELACLSQAMRVRALDPNVRDTKCVVYTDPTPSNMG